MAIAFMVVLGLFQFFGAQVMRGQRMLNEATYARYLADAALTEITALLHEKVEQNPSIDALFGEEFVPEQTQALAASLLGGRTPGELKVEVLKKDLGDGAWNSDPDGVTAWGDYEKAGTLVLLATVEVGGIKVGATRGFEFRVLSPAPPAGLDKVTFLAHSWDYFSARVQQAVSELWNLAENAEVTRLYSGIIVDDRYDALFQSHLLGSQIRKLSDALAKTANDGGPGQNFSALETAVREGCPQLSDCGLGGRDHAQVTKCLVMASELRSSWNALVAANFDRCVSGGGGSSTPPPTTGSTSSSPASCLQTAALLVDSQRRDAFLSAASGATDGASLQNALNTEGVAITQCAGKDQGTIDNEIQALHERYVTTGLWVSVVATVLESALERQVEQMQSVENGAGKQLELKTLLAYGSDEMKTSVNGQRTGARAALDTLEPNLTGGSGGNISDYQYPGFADLGNAVGEFQSQGQSLDQIFNQYLNTGADSSRADRSGLQTFLTNLDTRATDFANKLQAYLEEEDVRKFTRGPVYLDESASPVDHTRLQYLFLASPTRTDIHEKFPLPWPPWSSSSVSGGGTAGEDFPNPYGQALNWQHRGFLTVHANFGTSSLEGGVTFEPDYKPQGDIMEALKNTEGIARSTALAMGASSPTYDQQVLDLIKPEIAAELQSALDPPSFDTVYSDALGSKSKKDDQAMSDWVDEWNDRVNKFKQKLKETHDQHQSPAFIAWPEDPPGDEVESTSGWETPFETSKGQNYVGKVLQPATQETRAAYKFDTWAAFRTFLDENKVDGQGYRVYGVYLINEADANVELGEDLPFDGPITMVFPGAITVKSNLRSLNDEPLVIFAQGVTLETPEISALIMCNGGFQAASGTNPTVRGSLITTGTPEADPSKTPDNYDEDAPYESQIFGELNPVTIEYKSPYPAGVAGRQNYTRLFMAPFRVAQDYQVSRGDPAGTTP